jgi:hypothetical protein
MVRKRSLSKPKPDQATTENPYNLLFPDDVKNQLSRIKKKDSMLFEQLGKRFEKLRTDPECGEVLNHKGTGKFMSRSTGLSFTGLISAPVLSS